MTSTPNNVPPAGATDVFVYTIRDGDGDLSTTTLTINLTDSGLVAPADSDVTVNENALDTTVTPPDLAAGTVTGSLPGSAAETDATQPAQRIGRHGAADLCAGERRQRGDRGDLRHHPGQHRTAPISTR